MPRKARRHGGFTLVEVLIVAIVLGILAAVVVPQFSSATADARLGTLTGRLAFVRNALELYRDDHEGAYPRLATFREQMLGVSRSDGTTAEVGAGDCNLGPYLQRLPVNPYTGTDTVGGGPPGSSAWHYDEQTGEFRANDSEDHRSH